MNYNETFNTLAYYLPPLDLLGMRNLSQIDKN
jgi:hypothetical protein